MADERPAAETRSGASRAPLLQACPDLVRSLTAEERSGIGTISVPVIDAVQGELPIIGLLEQHGTFAAIVLDGLVLHRLTITSEPGLRVLGRGDVISRTDAPASTLVSSSLYSTSGSVRLALLGTDFLVAARRAPRLFVELHEAIAEQIQRLEAQLLICQLPRVADRVLAVMWLLAEKFGRVTLAGTTLPVSLTHEALGSLVGARRPTVTLALGELAGRGALVHQDRGWLLLERPAGTAARATFIDEPHLLDQGPSGWEVPRIAAWGTPQTLGALSDSVRELRAQHAEAAEQVREQLRRAASSRQRAAELRRRIEARRAVSGQPPPST